MIKNQNTKVVNVKVAYIRPKYDNLKEWTKDENNVYIGRKNIVFIDGVRFPPQDSIWSNPFKISGDMSRDDVLEKYRNYLAQKLEDNPKMIDELKKLKDKNLGCWCNPDKCHGDILIEFINKYS